VLEKLEREREFEPLTLTMERKSELFYYEHVGSKRIFLDELNRKVFPLCKGILFLTADSKSGSHACTTYPKKEAIGVQRQP